MQLTDKDGNVFGTGGLEITSSDGKPKIPVINTDITIGTTAIVGGVSGRLLYDNAGVVGETSNISWNKTTNILTLNSDVDYTTYNRTIASSSYPLGTLFTQTIRSISQINHSGGTNGLTIGGGGGSPLFRIFDTGNTVIQTGGTYVDAGFKFDVIGSTRVTSLKTADIFPASASISLWTNSLNATSRFYTAPVHQDGRINFNAIAGGSDYAIIRAWHTGSFGLGTGSSATNAALTVRGDTLLVGPSGALYFMNGTFGPNNVPYRLAISTTATTTSFYSGVSNNLTNIESTKFEYTATSHTFYTGTTAGNQSNPNQYTPLFLSNLGNVGIGTVTLGTATKLTIGGTQTASSSIARGISLDTTLAASANNDVLVGLDIAPTFTNGAFTGLTNVNLRTKGIGLVIGSGVGYGALYGYSNDGVLQVTDGGTSAITGFTYATQLWLRPSGNAAGLNSNYWATIEQSTGGLYIQSGRYNSNLYLRTGRAGTSGNIYFNNAGGIMAMFFGATGNFTLNSITDAGYKLDVNGTARFQNTVFIKNAYVSGGSVISFDATFNDNTNAIQVLQGTVKRVVLGSTEVDVRCDGPLIAGIGVGATTRAFGTLGFTFRTQGNGQTLIDEAGINAFVATSAILELKATTRGFLPPRMSNTQMLAIATPSEGLMVYDTTNRKLCCYDGATWQNLF